MTMHVGGPGSFRQRGVLRKILLVAFGLAVGLLFGEATMRLLGYSPVHVNPLRAFHQADPVLIYRGRPNVQGRFRRDSFDVLIKHNDRGFRAPAIEADRDAARRRVHAFGDSFTWGWGIESGEVFSDRLQQALPDHAICNYGVNGSGTALHVALLENEIASGVRPGDIVLLMFFQNDFSDNLVERRLHGRIQDGEVLEIRPESNFDGGVGQWLKDTSNLANFAAFLWDFRKQKRLAEEQRAREDRAGGGPTPEAVVVARHFLKRFRDLARTRGATPLLFWVAPKEHVEARARGESTAFFDSFVSLAKELECEWLEPTDQMVAAMNLGNALFIEGDGHWSAAGHAIAAEVLAQHLRSR